DRLGTSRGVRMVRVRLRGGKSKWKCRQRENGSNYPAHWLHSRESKILGPRASRPPLKRAGGTPAVPGKVIDTSIRDTGEVVLVFLLGGKFFRHQFLLLGGEGVDFLLLIGELLEVSRVNFGFLGRLTQILANPVLVGVETLEVGDHLLQL